MAVHTTTRAILATTLLFSPSRTHTHTHTHTCAHACTHTCHSCQPLLGVNLSPEFVNLYFPYAGQVLSFFFAGGSGIFNSNWHMWQWKEEAMLCKVHMRYFRSHFQGDFLAYCTGPVSVHLAMACVGCTFNSFSIFLLSLKQQSLIKIMFSCIHFLIWPYPHKIMKKTILYW